MAIGRYAYIYYENYGIRFRGVIELIEYSTNESNVVTLVISGSSLAAELINLNTYTGIAVSDSTPSAALTAILASASAWTPTVTGSGFSNLTTRWDAMSLLEAALKLAAMSYGFIRETNTARELELKNEYTTLSTILANVDTRGLALVDGETVAPIKALRSYRLDGRELYNRIVPTGRPVDAVLDLSKSTRTLPYTIQNAVQAPPTVVDSVYLDTAFPDTGDGVFFFEQDIIGPDIVCRGANRLLVVTVFLADIDTGDNVRRVYADGRLMTEIETTLLSTRRMSSYYLQNPKEGTNSIKVTYVGTTTDAHIIATALQDVLQNGSPIRNTTEATGTSTSPSVTVTSAVDDLVIDAVGHASATSSLGADQSYIQDQSLIESSKQIGASSVVMSWTLGSSVAWVQHGFSIKPQPYYYIESSASVTAYGRRVKILQDVDIRSTAGTEIALANSLYDAAAEYLIRHSDKRYYDVEMAFMPDDSFLPGDIVRLLFTGVSEDSSGTFVYLNIDQVLIITKIVESWDRDGVRHWTLTLSTTLLEAPWDNAMASRIANDLVGVKRANSVR